MVYVCRLGGVYSINISASHVCMVVYGVCMVVYVCRLGGVYSINISASHVCMVVYGGVCMSPQWCLQYHAFWWILMDSDGF